MQSVGGDRYYAVDDRDGWLCELTISLVAAEAVTKHYSFANGYPKTTTRQTTGASFGASSSASSAKKGEEKSLVGKVVRVESGDQICVTPTGGARTKVRLADIDTPEQGQPSGVEAKKFLFDLVNGIPRSGANCVTNPTRCHMNFPDTPVTLLVKLAQ